MSTKFSTGTITRLLGKNGTDTGADGMRGIFANCVIALFTGAPPATPDLAHTGTLLGYITLGGNAFTPGSPTNGLNFGAPVGKTLGKASGEDWKFKGIAEGTIGSYRLMGNAVDNYASPSTILPRVDGTVGITSGSLRMSSVTATINGIITVDAFTVTGS